MNIWQKDIVFYEFPQGQITLLYLLATHFHSVFECARSLGWLDQVRVDHVPFGVVLGEDKKKFKTRSGDTVRLVDLLDEGVKRAQQKLEEKAKERDETFSTEEIERTATALAYGCIKVIFINFQA